MIEKHFSEQIPEKLNLKVSYTSILIAGIHCVAEISRNHTCKDNRMKILISTNINFYIPDYNDAVSITTSFISLN